MFKQRILKSKNKLVIICDYREREIIKLLKGFDVSVNRMNLEVGDFICSERVAIERKTHSDFISSIIDGRIFNQVKLLKKSFEKPIIIIEGYSNREINDNALKATIATLVTNYGISLINTKNIKDSAKMIYWIAKKEQEEQNFGLSFKVRKKPKDLENIKEFIISSFPGISVILAKRLLKHFKTIQNFINADENQLKKVPGIGNKLAKKIKKIIQSEYKK
jgi:Fanconi anemia group M protein